MVAVKSCIMSRTFFDLIHILRKYCLVDLTIPLDNRGKPSRFMASVRGLRGREDSCLGVLDYNWNRSLGVDQVTQASRYAKDTSLDGVLILANKFSDMAKNQAKRISERENTQMLLVDRNALNSHFL